MQIGLNITSLFVLFVTLNFAAATGPLNGILTPTICAYKTGTCAADVKINGRTATAFVKCPSGVDPPPPCTSAINCSKEPGVKRLRRQLKGESVNICYYQPSGCCIADTIIDTQEDRVGLAIDCPLGVKPADCTSLVPGA